MADGAVNFVLDKLTTLLLQKASLLGDAYGEFEEIKLELESMRSFLKDAERRKERSESVQAWVRQVREVANQVEDTVDEFMHYKDTQRDKKGLKEFVISLPKNIAARQKISSKLQKIKATVHEVSERSKRYAFDGNIDEGRSNNASIDWWWQHQGELSNFIEEDEIVGMEENRRNLLKWLTEDDPRRTIISIVGMGGLGKTTLVTKVYSDHTIKKHFDCSAWISVPQSYGVEELRESMIGVEELLRSMIKEFFKAEQVMVPNNLRSMNYRQLGEMVIDYLHQKRYVIVLDDVWSIDLWSRIRGVFPDNNCSSRIIFTTRNVNVAISVGPGGHVHRLEPLRETDAWTLFCKKTFWNDPGHSCPKALEKSARLFVEKCEGLPLAIVAIGGLMCSRNKTVVEWKKVYDSLNWQLSNNPMLERVKGIFMLSFNDLPFYLKHCFLYCCVFRDGYPIKRKKLVRLWVAEGFIIERKGMAMEEVAEDYLTELIFRSMIQVTETNDAGRVKTCTVHDVMGKLAVTISEKEKFCVSYDGPEATLEGKIQRLSLYNRGVNIRLGRTLSHDLRSFFVFQTDVCCSFSLSAVSSNFKFLRVLDLQEVLTETIPGALVNLFNLRYLNLRETKVKELPKSIERLKNLQTLDVRNSNVKRLPTGISKLPKLRHLLLCPDNFRNSESSYFLCGMQVPAGIWNIKSLQTLSCVEAEEELIQKVGNLTDLKRLDVTKLRTVDGPMLCNSIQRMTSLLRLGVMARTDEELQLEALLVPPSFLQKLTLVGKLSRLPHWLGSLANLTHLYLGSSRLEEDILLSIHALPLAFLGLKQAYEGRLLHFKAGWFPKLNKLNLIELIRLDTVIIEEGALPRIREMYIIRCQQLKLLPQGIEHLTSLQKWHLE
ncbi:disease resistance protein RPM1-like [Cornus florida]|uniref:disease resistance protein RPM1-like n=1 Tax=Cornus florida TaxID=4283 RepID=UPI00289AFE2C|nr:disease resistance protein RPM1-like [Cornus florida]